MGHIQGNKGLSTGREIVELNPFIYDVFVGYFLKHSPNLKTKTCKLKKSWSFKLAFKPKYILRSDFLSTVSIDTEGWKVCLSFVGLC